VPVGTVASLSVEHDQAVATLLIQPDASIRVDVVAGIRARSLLGEKYVELRPQSLSAPLLADGAVLVIEVEQTEIDEMVNAIGPMLTGIDPERMGALIARLDDALAADPERLIRWSDHVDAILEHGAASSVELPALIAETRSMVLEARATIREVDQLAHRASSGLESLESGVEPWSEVLEDGPAMASDAHHLLLKMDSMMDTLGQSTDDLAVVMRNMAEIDKVELRRLLREEGILVRLRSAKVEPTEPVD